MMKNITAAAAAIAMMTMTGCGSSNGTADQAKAGQNSLAQKWQIADVSGNSTDGARNEAFITFDGKGGVSGCTGANLFNGSYTSTADGELTFGGDIVSTRMAAGPYHETEQAVFQALAETKRYSIDGDEAKLIDGSGREVMRLKK